MDKDRMKLHLRIIVNFLTFLLLLWLVFSLFPKVLFFFLPFVIGWVIALIANPLVRFLERRIKLRRKFSSAIIVVLVIGAVVGVLYLLLAGLFRELRQLVKDLPSIIESSGVFIENIGREIQLATASLPDNISNTVDDIVVSIGGNLSDYIKNISLPSLDTAGNIARNVADVLLIILISIISAYFFIDKRDDIVENVKKRIPMSINSHYNMVIDNFKTAVGGYFKAQFKIMFIVALIIFIGLEILDIKYSMLIALGTAFLDFLPVFGTGAVLWPWALYSVIIGDYPKAVGLMIIYLICQIIKQVIQPKMVGDSVGISPLSTLVFMYIGYQLYSIIGMIIAIPIGMVIVNLYRAGMFDRLIKGVKIIVHDINEFRKF